MRTYDPADCILYVHMTAGPAPPPEECHELPADYANASLRDRIGPPPVGRPALVLLSGGAAPADEVVPAAPALTLAQ